MATLLRAGASETFSPVLGEQPGFVWGTAEELHNMCLEALLEIHIWRICQHKNKSKNPWVDAAPWPSIRHVRTWGHWKMGENKRFCPISCSCGLQVFRGQSCAFLSRLLIYWCWRRHQHQKAFSQSRREAHASLFFTGPLIIIIIPSVSRFPRFVLSSKVGAIKK